MMVLDMFRFVFFEHAFLFIWHFPRGFTGRTRVSFSFIGGKFSAWMGRRGLSSDDPDRVGHVGTEMCR